MQQPPFSWGLLRLYSSPTKEYTLPTQEHTLPTQEYALPIQEHTLPTQKYTLPTQEYTIPHKSHIAYTRVDITYTRMWITYKRIHINYSHGKNWSHEPLPPRIPLLSLHSWTFTAEPSGTFTLDRGCWVPREAACFCAHSQLSALELACYPNKMANHNAMQH